VISAGGRSCRAGAGEVTPRRSGLTARPCFAAFYAYNMKAGTGPVIDPFGLGGEAVPVHIANRWRITRTSGAALPDATDLADPSEPIGTCDIDSTTSTMIRLFTRGLIRAAMTGWTAPDDIELATVTWRAYPTPRPGRSASASQAEQAAQSPRL